MDDSNKSQEIPFVQEKYRSDFKLDGRVLVRIVSIVEEKFREMECSTIYTYDVCLKGGEKVSPQNTDELLKLDNTIRNPIRSVKITVSGNRQNAKLIECSIRFTPPNLLTSKDSKRYENILLKVITTNSEIASQLIAELEEQLYRTFIRNWKEAIVKVGSLLGIGAIIGSLFFSLPSIVESNLIGILSPVTLPSSGIEYNYEELNEIFAIANLENSINAKINFLYELQKEEVQQVLEARKIQKDFFDAPVKSLFREIRNSLNEDLGGFFKRIKSIFKFASLRVFFIASPVLISLILLLYAAVFCSPSAVFLWGDYEIHYKNLVARRKMLLTTVASTIVLGILTNLFVNSLQP